VATVVVVLLAACGSQGGSAATDTLDGQALVEERCSECHPLTRVTEARKTQAEWQSTVERMVAQGARLNEEEQRAVVEYLAETYPAQ
jgi:hypothetical protein